MASLSEMGWPTIPDFYAHKDVFITGATGLMGKCLVEKLLRSIPDIGRVIILMRTKKGKAIKERTTELLKSPVSAWRRGYAQRRRNHGVDKAGEPIALRIVLYLIVSLCLGVGRPPECACRQCS